MATLRDLANRLNSYVDKLDEVEAEAKARYALAILKALLNDTPVDTTEAVSNWRVGTGVSSPIPPHVPGESGFTRAASIAIAIQEAVAALRAHKYADVLVIFNSAGHIRYLDEGSSAQAPAGFVAKAVLAGKLAARSQKGG